MSVMITVDPQNVKHVPVGVGRHMLCGRYALGDWYDQVSTCKGDWCPDCKKVVTDLATALEVKV